MDRIFFHDNGCCKSTDLSTQTLEGCDATCYFRRGQQTRPILVLLPSLRRPLPRQPWVQHSILLRVALQDSPAISLGLESILGPTTIIMWLNHLCFQYLQGCSLLVHVAGRLMGVRGSFQLDWQQTVEKVPFPTIQCSATVLLSRRLWFLR